MSRKSRSLREKKISGGFLSCLWLEAALDREVGEGMGRVRRESARMSRVKKLNKREEKLGGGNRRRLGDEQLKEFTKRGTASRS